jgi:hypothetical protein
LPGASMLPNLRVGFMTGRNISTDNSGQQADLLDHSREFVEIVYRSAPGEYHRLLGSEKFQQVLANDNAFNYGKLFAFAEFAVFRQEFKLRFPEASPASCINAFSRLFLKNDISITNLVRFMEGSNELEQLRLNEPDQA